MQNLSRLFFFVFVQSFATVMLQRGTFFFTKYKLQYSDSANLLLALGVGVCYTVSALLSHRVSARLGEKRTMLVSLAGQIICSIVIGLAPTPAILAVMLMAFSSLNALMWPNAESFTSAGRSPIEASRAIGMYNIAWSTAVPLSLWASGPIISHLGSGLFLVSAGLSVLSAFTVFTFPPSPAHHPQQQADVLPPDQRALYHGLLVSSRCSMVASYAMIFTLTPLMPELFKSLGFGVTWATALAACLDAARTVTFLVMLRNHRWHGGTNILIWTALLLPIGFFVTLSGHSVFLVLVGEAIFGVAMGLAYYAALYYSMVVGHASVGAGGAHEGLIGSGFALGPGITLLGQYIGRIWDLPNVGTFAGMAPLILACLAGGLWPLLGKSAQKTTRTTSK